MKATFSMLALLLASAVVTTAQQANTTPANATTYAWHAELVSFDQTAKTITVKTQVVAPTAAAELKNFKAGDRVLLHWSGFDTSANGVRGVMKYDASQSAKEPFLLPVELVTPMPQNDYITIKLRAPDSATAALKAVKAGEWITITSKHRPAGDADQIVGIRPYVQAPTQS